MRITIGTVLILTAGGCTSNEKPNYVPIANAGFDLTVAPGTEVQLDGSQSSDGDGDITSWLWAPLSMPTNSEASLSDAGTTDPVFNADLAGTYSFSLVVEDNQGNRSIPDVVNVLVVTGGTRPVADLSLQGAPILDQLLTLDGSHSYDIDGEPLDYTFSLEVAPENSTAIVAPTDSPDTSTITPDLPGVWVVGLTVDNGLLESNRTDVAFEIRQSQEGQPIAVCGETISVPNGTAVTLDGTDSYDLEGDPITYSWSMVEVPTNSGAALDDATSSQPGFTTDIEGSYVAALTVHDGTLYSIPCEQQVFATPASGNDRPNANAGDDQDVELGAEVVLDGTYSTDPDGHTLTYLWSFTALPPESALTNESIADSSTDTARFTPDVPGDFFVQLLVDDALLTDTDEAIISVTSSTSNNAPVANAGADIESTLGDAVTLDGTGSYDPDGDALSATWSFVSRPAESTLNDSNLVDPNSLEASFSPDVEGTYVIGLGVTDGVAYDTDTVSVNVSGSSVNTPPVAEAGETILETLGNTVTLDGTGSYDPDGDPLLSQWAFVTVPPGSALTDADIVDINSLTPSFTPDVSGTWVLGLGVYDGLDYATDSVLVVVSPNGGGGNNAPIADAGNTQTITLGDTVTLDGTASSDPDGDALLAQWAFVSVPVASLLTDADLVDINSLTPSFTPDIDGIYVVGLGVTDGLETATDSVTITVTSGGGGNNAPIADAGNAQTIALGDTVTLDGTASSDPDGDALLAQWSFVLVAPGSGLTDADITDINSLTPSFTPDIDGIYELGLGVTDGLETATDSVTITVTAGSNNTAPVADAGPDVTIDLGDIVTLDGTNSSDADGDVLTFAWLLDSTPNGSTLTEADIAGVNSATPIFTPDVAGEYTLTLRVNDGTTDGLDEVVITVLGNGSNTPPVADAGPDQVVDFGEVVFLDASASTDADGDALTFNWSMDSVPAASAITDADITDPAGTITEFTPDVEGDYTLRLEVDDGTDTDVTTLLITVNPLVANTPPVADAGPDQAVNLGDTVQLDGSASSDADGDPLTYQWYFQSKPAATALTFIDIQDRFTNAPSFTPDVEGTFTLHLDVGDGTDTAVATMDVVVSGPSNTDPVADAGADQSVALGDTVQLDGGASSDADGDSLTYNWFFFSKPSSTSLTFADIQDRGTDTPLFTPDVEGTFTVYLEVSDGTVTSSDTVDIVVNTTTNTPPVADAGTDQSVNVGDTVLLDGSASSDADGDPLTHHWFFLSKPAATNLTFSDIQDRFTANPSFTPDVGGTFTLYLEVDDGTDSANTTVNIVVTAPPNNAPIANAGSTQSVTLGDTVQLDGTGSSDADGDPLTYTWFFFSKPASTSLTFADIQDRNTDAPSFTPDVEGTFTVFLEVSDGTDTGSTTVDIVVTAPPNTPPVANAGASQTAGVGDTVLLDGSGSSDPDGDPLTYSWFFQSKPATTTLTFADIQNRFTATPSFIPDVAGTFTLFLEVSDGTDTANATVDITATAPTNNAPVADAGADQAGGVGDTLSLDGSGSSDPDGDALSYNWLLLAPIGSNSTLTGATTETPSFVPDIAGTYTALLQVSDGLATDNDSVDVLISASSNSSPVAVAGQNQSIPFSSTASLNGSNSFDPDGDPLSYSWTFTRIPAGSGLADSDISGASTAFPSFVPDIDGIYRIRLTVDDGADTSSDTTVVNVYSGPNAPPVADAGPDQGVGLGETVQLDGTNSYDPDGDPFTYDWFFGQIPSDSNLIVDDIDDFTAASTSFTPDVAGTYVLVLLVSDSSTSSRDEVTIYVGSINGAPTADAGTDQVVTAGDTVFLDGTASSDPDGDALIYQWTLIAPGNSTSGGLDDATAAQPQFDTDVAGTYMVFLQVSDGQETATAMVTITAQ